MNNKIPAHPESYIFSIGEVVPEKKMENINSQSGYGIYFDLEVQLGPFTQSIQFKFPMGIQSGGKAGTGVPIPGKQKIRSKKQRW